MALGAAFGTLGESMMAHGNIGKAINLFLVGLILGGAFLRAGTLWLNAGLHGGWIFGLLLFTGLTRSDGSGEPGVLGVSAVPQIHRPFFWYWIPPWYGNDILSNPLTTLVLLLTGLWLWRFYRHPSIVPEDGPGSGENAS